MDEKVETQAEDNNATRKVSFRPQPGIVEAFFPPSHGIQSEPTFITSNLRPSIFGKLNGGMRVTNYSVQTGEEFALQFAQQASRAQRGSEMEQVSLQKFNAHEASPYVYEDLTGILGIGRVDSGTHSEISMLAPEKGNLSDFGSYCNPTYTESLQGVQIPCSGNDGGYQMDEGVFAPSAWQTRSQHTPYSSTQRSHLSGRSNDSSRGKVKFMCSFGGKILPRPSDGKLRYVGGETRIITVNKDIGYEELMQKTMDFYSQALILKYQLPGEDLDALVSVSSDEDLENMMEEYDKLENSNGSSRLRIFLFTAGDNDLAHFDAIADKRYSEQQYVDAINGIPDTSVRKHSESLGSFSSHHLDNLIGLDVAENWNTNRRAPEGLDPLQPQFSKDGTKIVNLPNVRPSSSKAVVSGADFPPLLSAPFSSLPMHVEQSVVADSPIHFHPEQINSHSYSVARPAEGYHDIDSGRSFPSSALFQHEVQYKHTESRMSLKSPTNHQNDFLLPSHSDFMFKGGGRLADTNVVQPILNPKSDGLHPVDLQRIAQVPPSGHQAVWHPHFDKEHYAYTTIDFIPQVISPGLHLQQPVQHTMQKIPLNVLQTANHDTAVSRYTDRVHISHDDILEGPRDSILRNEHHLDVLKEVGSSPPSPSHGGGGKLNAQVQQTHNVPHLDEEDSGPRVPLDNNRFDGVFCPSASPDSSGQFYEEAVYEQNSHHDKSYSEEQFTHHETLSHEQVISSDERFIRPQALPHVLSDTVLSKSVHPISEGISVSQGHHSDSLLGAIPLYVGSSKSEEQSISFQDHEGMGDAQSRIIHQSEQIPAVSSGWQQSKVTHVSGESLKDESDNDIKQKSLEKDDKMHAVMRTSLDQSECSDRKQIAQLSERTYAKSAVSHGRIGSSDGMDTTVTLGLGDSYQAYQKPDDADTLGEASYQVKVPTSGGPIGATGIATEATQVPHLSGRINHMALPGSGPNAQEGGIESHVPSSTSGIWLGEMTVERDHTKVEAPRYAHEPTGNLLDDSTVNNDMISPQYLPGQFLEKSLIDEDYVNSANQLYAINKFLDDLATHVPATTVDPFNHDISKGLFQQPAGNKAGRNQMESSSTRELSAHLDAVAVGLAHVNLHELENKGESHNVSQDMAASVDLNFPPALVSEWGPVSEDVRVDENISLGKVAEVVDEETITTQDSDNDEAKLDDSDKDELSDSALAEMEAIAHGLQIIKNADLEELRELGSGTFGTVYHGKWRGTDVAIKRIKNSCFTGRPSEQERMRVDFWREAWMLANLHHPNVVAFYGVVPDGPGGTLATVTEYMVNGSLKQVLQRKDSVSGRTIDRKRRLLIAMDAAFGMEYLHGKSIVHFDLKCENLLVNMRDPQRPICKVGDLGLSKIKHQTLVSGGVRGTLPWMAPELLNGSSSMVSEKVDVFSFGIVMWELLTGEEPYANMHYGAIIGGIVNNTLRPHVPNWCDPSWRALMEQCWSPDPAARPTFSEIANRLRSMAMSIHSKGHGHHPHVHHGLS